ncbi:MAG: hypothetical protein ACTSQS_04240 [Promethearchaeota archaeon]
MTFCGNVLELIEREKIIESPFEFVKWSDIINNDGIDVYIEKSIIPELDQKEEMIIDAAIGEINGKKIGMLFIKKDKDVYG